MCIDSAAAATDQLAFDRTWATNWYASRNPPMFPVLETMSRVFGLAPWPDVPARLAELHHLHHDKLLSRRPLMTA